MSVLGWPDCRLEYTGFSCAFVPGKSILLKSAVFSWISFASSSPSAPRPLAASTAVAISVSSFSRRIISSFSPFKRVMKGLVHGSPIGKLNFSFCWIYVSFLFGAIWSQKMVPWVYDLHVEKPWHWPWAAMWKIPEGAYRLQAEAFPGTSKDAYTAQPKYPRLCLKWIILTFEETEQMGWIP